MIARIRTAIWNARFNLGYRIGGFTAAERLSDEEARNRVDLTLEQLWTLVFQAAGAATGPLLQDHPDYVFPSERVADRVTEYLVEEGYGPPPPGYSR